MGDIAIRGAKRLIKHVYGGYRLIEFQLIIYRRGYDTVVLIMRLC